MSDSIEYKRLREISDAYSDTNSCSIIATAAATDLPYKLVSDAFEVAGRKHRHGAHLPVIKKALESLGCVFDWHKPGRYVKDYVHSNKLTFNNCERLLDVRKRYIVIGKRHMAALKDGKVIDWAEGRRMHIDDVIEIKGVKVK
jgi:hypothetical protein